MFRVLHRKHSSKGFFRYLAIAVVFAFALAASGCNFLPAEEEALPPPLIVPEEIAYKTIKIEPGTISNSFRAGGTVISSRQESISFTKVAGRLDSISVSYGDKVEEGALLASLIIGDIENSIVTGELDYRKVEINYIQARDRYNAGQITALDLEKSAIDLKLSQIRLDKLREQLDSSKIFAPYSGRVVYIADIEHNDRVETFQTMVTIADMSQLLIRYTGDNYENLVPGTKVDVLIARSVYPATVIASGVNAPAGSGKLTEKSVLIQTDEPLPDTTILGSNAYFEYEIERSENTIVIPRRLLNVIGGREYINVLVDGIRVERDVLTGVESSTDVEILSGLEIGELLIDR